MKFAIKILGIAVLASAFAGTAFAGNVVTSATDDPCRMMKRVYAKSYWSNPKFGVPGYVLVGYRHVNCAGTKIENMNCTGSRVTCAAMLQSSFRRQHQPYLGGIN